MPVPDFQSCMLPLLKALSDGTEKEYKIVKKQLAQEFKLSESELLLKIPSGRAYLFDNRVGWANTYLKKAGLISSQRKGFLQITPGGLELVKSGVKQIKIADLKKYEPFRAFLSLPEKQTESDESITEVLDKSPEELMESSFETLRRQLADDLLSVVKSCSPRFFERMVIDLLLKMGYGGSRKEAGTAIGRSGDGGIDGIISEDKLGMDNIYIQAKRWENTVPVKEVRDFAGSLMSKKAKKGIFLTTSDFPKSAYEFVGDIDHKIILIDGERLTSLMIEYDVGVSPKDTYTIKAIDNDYFEE